MATNNSNKSFGQQNADRRGDVGENTRKSDGGRNRARNERNIQERRRQGEIEDGTFYSRLNAGRSTVVSDAVNGVVGIYAFPGGDEPSLHVEVSSEIIGTGKVAVIKFEAVQRGHELEGVAFDPTVYLRAYYVEKFGSNFSPRMGGMAGKTQKLIMSYMLKLLDGYGAPEVDEVPPTVSPIEELFARAKTDDDSIRAMLNGAPGLYGVKSEKGLLVIRGYHHYGKPRLQVAESSIEGVVAGNYFLPTHPLWQASLEKVTSPKTYEMQFAFFMFLRNMIGHLLVKQEPTPKTPLNSSGRPMGKKEMEKQERRKALKLAEANERATEATAVANMKAKAVTLRDTVAGKQGWVVLPHSSGDLIVLYGTVGADKVVQVTHLGENHILRLAGVDLGTRVLVGQVQAGGIDQIDRINHKLNDGQVKACNALITYLRDQLEANGIKLISRKPNLRMVKAA